MTIDLTGIIVALIGGVFSVVTLVVGAWITRAMSNAQAAATLSAAVGNALGAIQQAAEAAAKGLPPLVIPAKMPGIPPKLAVGVQYVIDNAGDEMTQLGVTPALIASKIDAKLGLANIASNIQSAASTSPTMPPLAPIPPLPPSAPQAVKVGIGK
jgi:hypothetical protein